MQKIFLFLSIYLLISFSVLAKENNHEIILNWQAYNFFPNFYLGKPLPTQNSNLEIGVIFLENNKIINLNNYLIKWFIDNQLYQEKLGLNKIYLTIQKPEKNFYHIKTQIIDSQEKIFEKSIIINITKPKIVLETIKKNNELVLKSWPYFFNVKNFKELNFNWIINNKNYSLPETNEILIKNINNTNSSMIEIINEIINNKNQFETAVIKKNINKNE